MAKIACVLAEGFEDSEFKAPYDAFRKAGHQVDVVGVRANQSLHGYRGQETASTDKSFDEVDPSQYDALFIPGGHSPDKLRADDRAVKFVSEFDETSKPVMAICHGPQLLMAARRIEGRTLTAWKTVQRDLALVPGVRVVDEPVVKDRNWITSRQPSDIPSFIEASLQTLPAKH